MIKIYMILFLVSSVSFAQSACNCCSDDQTKFDFWVGEWTVTNPSGNTVGENTISKVQNGCVLREQWVATNGTYTGTSYNFFNQTTNEWEQLWVDNQGRHLKLSGNIKGNSMVLQSVPTKNAQGTIVMNRITWTPNADGTVRQLWEVIAEDGSVSVAFNGLYRKKD